MAIIKFAYIPDASGYVVEDAAADVIAIKLDGGASRYRRDRIGSNSKVSVRWTLDPSEYRYFRMFYRFLTDKGAKPFLIDLVLDTEFPAEHTAHFIPGSVRLQEQRGQAYIVSAELEVEPTVIENEDEERAAAILFSIFGPSYEEDFPPVESKLDVVVNLHLPGDFQ